jgi:hypothetical protein
MSLRSYKGANVKGTRKKTNRIIAIDIVVIRINSLGEYGQSRPCFHCIQYMKSVINYRIRHVYFTTSKTEIKKMHFSELDKIARDHISSGNRSTSCLCS